MFKAEIHSSRDNLERAFVIFKRILQFCFW